MWLSRIMLVGIAGVGACASSNPSPAPVEEQWVETAVPQLGLKLRRPVGWQIVPDPAAPGATPHADAVAGIVLIKDIDDRSTIIVLQRFWKGDREIAPNELLAELLQASREAARKDGRIIIEDLQRRIAGCPAGIMTADGVQVDFALRTMSVCFVSPTHEYTLLVAGQRDFFDDVRPKVMKLIDSMELIEPQKEK
jgi:hypothetical protein